MVVTLRQQYNAGEKPTVILYTNINRHAGTPDKKQKQNRKYIVHNQTWYNSDNVLCCDVCGRTSCVVRICNPPFHDTLARRMPNNVKSENIVLKLSLRTRVRRYLSLSSGVCVGVCVCV